MDYSQKADPSLTTKKAFLNKITHEKGEITDIIVILRIIRERYKQPYDILRIIQLSKIEET